VRDLRQFVEERLTAMHARPHMWAWTKEGFALQVALLVEVLAGEDFESQHLLGKLFPENKEGVVPSASGSFDDAWAHGVVEIARQELP
jgi:hypothetical protein